jgi:hypothetical protein
MAAAPEGATNGLSEVVNPLEPGIAQLGFWCAEDLHQAGREQQVLIVPIGIQYSYVQAPWRAIANLLSELEAASGLPVDSNSGSDVLSAELLYPRLLRLAERLLSLMEEFYRRFYHQTLPEVQVLCEDTNEVIAARLHALLDTVLQVAEQYFGIKPKGNFSDRCRRVEQAGWNYIFREEYKDIKALSPLEIALGSRIAEEANMRMWHMRLVENFVAVTGKYVREKPTVERFAETTLLIRHMVAQILPGGNPFRFPPLGKQRVKMTVGKPLSVSERYSLYQGSRQQARQAVADLTKDLQQAMEGLIVKQ